MPRWVPSADAEPSVSNPTPNNLLVATTVWLVALPTGSLLSPAGTLLPAQYPLGIPEGPVVVPAPSPTTGNKGFGHAGV